MNLDRILLLISIAIITLLFLRVFEKSKVEHLPYIQDSDLYVYQQEHNPWQRYVMGIEVSEKLYWIIKNESEFNPEACNHQYGCKAGMGLIQVIPSTLKECEIALKRELDPYNPKDSIECGEYLLTTSAGINHWGTEYSWWGSYNKFYPKVKHLVN
ncbi:MAG: transglycosylase SLT domain-containing protein [Elusimicrobiota bacterium]